MDKLVSSCRKKNGIIKLKIVAKKLQKSLLLGRKQSSYNERTDSTYVPKDVKQGHFAVIAVDGEEPKRFVVPLSYLTHPTFLRLLEKAAEEYGFDREGALTIPCRPAELERILAERWEESSGVEAINWGACKPMVQSC
ncbi:hypothetical protein K2173_023663 [Erythroxylum novogranatense]|uniref:Small auxin up regulated protein n=1 Tax=Erythroxylum novogranatense TaxID=1862640 RepID=A0AAV8TRL7_9ROSI|nr:hypothetical protein K2173_023663 [Erythroxylum novogranatense]